jgi:PAS domain S-box-containing protein
MQNDPLRPSLPQIEAARLQALADAAADGIFVKDHQRRYTFANRAMCDLLRCGPGDLLGRTAEQVFDAESARVIREIEDRVFAGEAVQDTREIRVGGERRVLEATESPLETGPDGVESICCFVHDVTASVDADAALRRSEEGKRALLAAMPDLMFLIGRDGTFLDCHSADPALLFAPPESFLGRKVADILPPALAQPTLAGVEAALATGRLQSFEYDLRLGPEVRWFEARLVACGEQSAVSVVRDITDQRRAKDALAAEKERLAVTLRSLGEGVITTDTAGRIVLLNRVAEELTGWSQASASGRLLGEVFRVLDDATREPADDPVARVQETGRIVKIPRRTVLVSKDGTQRVVAGRSAPIRDDGSRLVGVVVVFRDVTEQLRMEEEARRTQKLESLGLLAGGIAHDFNNLLTGILGNVSLARLRSGDDPEQDEWLKEAERAIERARGLTQQLLTFSKGGAPIRRTARIGELIAESARFSLRGSNVRCECAIAPDLWSVEVDEGQMSQVIANLVVNAVEAMPDGGTVRVNARNHVPGSPLPVDLPEGRYVEIAISDEGIGIPEELRHRIFDPYFTSKKRGSGLGLTTSDAIVRKHDGKVTVESRTGQGSTFTVFLPASFGEPAPRAVDAAPRPGHGRILVMDDDAVIRTVCSRMLAYLGYECETACDGAEALRVYATARDAGRPFDAVIMDLTVPGGMGGKEGVRRLLEIDAAAKVVVSSGYSNDAIMSDYRSHGFVGVVVKPYELNTLGRTLREVLSA